MIKKIYPSLLIIVFCLLISFPVILPYFHPGYFPTHDGEWAVVRLGDMFRSLRDHQFPVRYSGNLNFGYGYPLFNFTYPAPYYIGVGFHFLKFGFVDTIKILFALSVVFSAIGMFLLSARLWGHKTAGFISAFFYVYFPYRIVDLYARGSIGESLSFALFPFVLFFLDKILEGKKTYLYVALGSLSYALLILTHNIMAVLFTSVLISFIAWRMYSKKSRNFLPPLIFIIHSLLLSAFFWLPAIVEKNSILLSRIPIADRSIYFVNLSQLITPRWGYGLPDHPDGFSYQIGLPHILILLTVIGLFLYFWQAKKKVVKSYHFQLSLLLVCLSVIFIFIMFSVSSVVWQLPLLKEINYPWTLLGPLGFVISLLAGFLCLQHKFIQYFSVVLCVVAGILILPNARPSEYFDKGDNYYLTNDATTTSSQELMPLWVKSRPSLRQGEKVEVIKGEGSISNSFADSRLITFFVDTKDKATLRINTIYYPGWTIRADGVIIPIDYTNELGVMDITISRGRHKVVAKFSETPLRLTADIVSLFGIIIVVYLIIMNRFRINFLKL